MEDNNEKEAFRYTYSANQQETVKQIREKYLPRDEEDKMAQLLRLDRSVTQKGMTASLSVGIISALILGTGLSCCTVWADRWFIPGIVIGLVGIVGISLAYPLYSHIIKKEREKIAPEIIRLTDALMQ